MASAIVMIPMKEIDYFLANLLRAFEIGEVSTSSQQGKMGSRDCLSDMNRAVQREVIVLSVNDQGRKA